MIIHKRINEIMKKKTWIYKEERLEIVTQPRGVLGEVF
jgi:hypothetical protein